MALPGGVECTGVDMFDGVPPLPFLLLERGVRKVLR